MRRIVDFVRRAGYKGGTGTGLALLAASAFSLAGCAVVGKIAAAVEKPTSTFRCGKFPSLDLGGASLGFTFDLDNPNGLELAGAGRVAGELVRGGGEAPGDRGAGRGDAPDRPGGAAAWAVSSSRAGQVRSSRARSRCAQSLHPDGAPCTHG